MFLTYLEIGAYELLLSLVLIYLGVDSVKSAPFLWVARTHSPLMQMVLALTCEAPVAWMADTCASVQSSTCRSRGSSCEEYLHSRVKFHSCKWSFMFECLPISLMIQFQTGPGSVMGPLAGMVTPALNYSLFYFYFSISLSLIWEIWKSFLLLLFLNYKESKFLINTLFIT